MFFGVRRSYFLGRYSPQSFISPTSEKIRVQFTEAFETTTYTFAAGFSGNSFAEFNIAFNAGNSINGGDYFVYSNPSSSFYTWFKVNGSGSDPFGPGTGNMVDILSTDTGTQVAAKVASAMGGAVVGNLLTYTASFYGSFLTYPTIVTGNIGSLTVINSGSTPTTTLGGITFFSILSGITENGFYAWSNCDSLGSDPGSQGSATNGIQIPLSGVMTAAQVCTAFKNAINSSASSYVTATSVGPVLTIISTTTGNTSAGGIFGGISVTPLTTVQGYGVPDYTNSAYILFWNGTTSYYAWLNIGSTGSNPMAGDIGIEVDFARSDSATTAAAALKNAIDLITGPFNTTQVGGVVTIENQNFGNQTNATQSDTLFNLTTITQGYLDTVNSAKEKIQVSFLETKEQTYFDFTSGVAANVKEQWTFAFNSAASINPSDAWFFTAGLSTMYTVWYTVDGSGSGPGFNSFQVDLLSTDDAATVASKTRSSISLFFGSETSVVGNVLTFSYSTYGTVTPPSPLGVSNLGVLTVTQTGNDPITNIGGIYIFYPGSGYYFWTNIDGLSSDPGSQGGASSGIQVPLSGAYTAAQLATAFAGIIAPLFPSDLVVTVVGARMTVTSVLAGACNDSGSFNSCPVTVTTNTQGFGPASYTQSAYCKWYLNSGNFFYSWFNKDSGGSDPALGGTNIQLAFSSSDTPASIATTLKTGIDAAAAGFAVVRSTATVSIQNPNYGPQTDATQSSTDYNLITLQQGFFNVDPAMDTITIANNHFPSLLRIRFSTTGTLPGGLLVGTVYYIIKIDTNTFKIASSLANAIDGIAINITSYGSGTHTIRQI